MTKKKRSPSRIKYEQNNPTVSARLPKETREKLLVNLAKLGMSKSDAFKVLAGEIELKVIAIDEARRQGYEKAKNRYMLTFPCRGCGKPIPIINLEIKALVEIFMTEYGWAHPDCC